jgi:mannosyltransferase
VSTTHDASPTPRVRAAARAFTQLGRAETLLVGACIAAGTVLRFTPSTPLWLDEALTVDIAAAPLGRLDDLLRHDGHPPLYYVLLHGWIQLFGTGAFAVRAMSGLLGLLTMALLFVVARRVAGAHTARLSVAVLAMSPFAIRYSSETRMYELVVVLVLAGWGLVDRALFAPGARDGGPVNRRVLVGLWFVTGALLLTHYWALFFVAACGIGLLAGAWRPSTAARRRSYLEVAAAVALGGLWFLPWLSVFRYQSAHTGTPWAPASRPTRVLSDSLIDWAGGIDPEALLLIAALSALVLLGLFGHRATNGRVELGAIEGGWRRRALWIIGATLTVGSAASLASSSAYAGRYSSVVFPFFVVLVGAGLAVLPNAAVRVCVLALVVLLGAGAVAVALTRDRTQAGQVAAALNASAAPGDLVVVCPDQLGPALVRLVHAPDLKLVTYPDLGDPHFVDWVDYADRLGAASVSDVADRVIADAGPHTIWLVWSGSYRTAGPQCDELAARLAAIRPGTSPEVQADPVKYFESSSLIRLVAR